MISVIILAAGMSERMGRMKQLMPFGSSTVLETTIERYKNSIADQIIVVLGHGAQRVRSVIGHTPVKVVVNSDYSGGLSTSLVAGLNNIDKRVDAVMIALGDQPLIETGTINLLIREFSVHDKGIAVPVYRDRSGHPVIFSLKYKDELMSLTGDTGARDIIRRYPSDVLEVPVTSESVCVDIDNMESYRQALEKLGNNRTGRGNKI